MLLLHRDQGSQDRAIDYRDLLARHEIVSSMSTNGCCWDNAVAERFFSTLKLDLDDDREVRIHPQELQRDLAFWNKDYYRRERRHSTIAHLSPIDDEQQFIASRTLSPVNP
jgi:transposase InsO family protein